MALLDGGAEVIKVRIFIRYREVTDSHGWHMATEPEYTQGQLINVFWHPIDGPHGAVLIEGNEIETFKLAEIEVVES